jgi:agmatine deiminase
MSWTMPAESAPHDRTWMAFPVPGNANGDDCAALDEARATWAEVAHAIAEFEPVSMVVDPGETAAATRYLSASIDRIVAPLDDAWMRDMGPTFVTNEAGQLGGIDWTFNGWGTDWIAWRKDALIAEAVLDAVGIERISSVLVNEGGGIHVDGEGTVLLTETVQLGERRNPFATAARVEAELERTIGATNFVWLPRGLTRDYGPNGTLGHVDIVATISSPGHVLIHAQRDREHPDFEVSRQVREVFERSTDSAGRSWNITELPAPDCLADEEGFVDYSYINHLVVNGGVVACGFGEDRADGRAREILAEAYPGREVVTVDARPLFARGGGIHCITQQQPSLS